MTSAGRMLHDADAAMYRAKRWKGADGTQCADAASTARGHERHLCWSATCATQLRRRRCRSRSNQSLILGTEMVRGSKRGCIWPHTRIGSLLPRRSASCGRDGDARVRFDRALAPRRLPPPAPLARHPLRRSGAQGERAVIRFSISSIRHSRGNLPSGPCGMALSSYRNPSRSEFAERVLLTARRRR